MIPLSDYNKTEGKAVKLADNEVLIYHRKNKNKSSIKNEETIHLNNDSYKVVDANLDSTEQLQKQMQQILVDGWYVIVKDTNIIKKYLKAVYGKDDMEDSVEDYHEFMQYVYSFNLDGSRTNRERTEQILQEQLQAKFASLHL